MANPTKREDDEDCYPFTGGRDGEPVKLQLSQEEMAVLRECRMNSLYMRGFPLGIFSVLGTRFLAHNYFPHVKRWAGFYYTASFSIGVFVGVLSYKDKCMQKIMGLKDSRLADQVREFQRRASRGMQQGPLGYGLEVSRKQEEGSDAHTSDRRSQTAGHWRSHRSERFRDNDANNDGVDEEAKGSSYEELRRINRARQSQGPRRLQQMPKQEDQNEEEASSAYDPDVSYDKRETYSAGSAWDSDLPKQSFNEQTEEQPTRGQWPQKPRAERKKTNKYGDEME